MALLWITHSTSPLNCWAACAEKQQTPAFNSGSSMVMAGSDPLSRQPFSRRTRAKARMPEPAMPIRWARRAWPFSRIEVEGPAFTRCSQFGQYSISQPGLIVRSIARPLVVPALAGLDAANPANHEYVAPRAGQWALGPPGWPVVQLCDVCKNQVDAAQQANQEDRALIVTRAPRTRGRRDWPHQDRLKPGNSERPCNAPDD